MSYWNKKHNSKLSFRDLELKTEFTCKSGDVQECFGSMYNLSFHSSNTALIKQRVSTIKEMLRDASM